MKKFPAFPAFPTAGVDNQGVTKINPTQIRRESDRKSRKQEAKKSRKWPHPRPLSEERGEFKGRQEVLVLWISYFPYLQLTSKNFMLTDTLLANR